MIHKREQENEFVALEDIDWGNSVRLEKSTMKDLRNLKLAHLDRKFKSIMEVLKENPFQSKFHS